MLLLPCFACAHSLAVRCSPLPLSSLFPLHWLAVFDLSSLPPFLMGQQCSGEEREAYIRSQEAARALEESARPVVVSQQKQLSTQPRSVKHPTVQHRPQQLNGERRRPPPGAFGYANERNVYGTNSSLPSSSSLSSSSSFSTPLTNASGAFTDPILIDKFYDVSVSQVLISAEQGANEQQLTNGSYRTGGNGAATAAWQQMQAIPYPTSGNSLPPLPYSSHSIHNDQSDRSMAEDQDPASIPLRWKPKFSKAITSLSRDSEGSSPAERQARKAQRAARRMEREEKEREQAQAMKDLRKRMLEAPGNRKMSEEKETPAVKQEALSFSYEREEEEEQKYVVPQQQQQQQQQPSVQPVEDAPRSSAAPSATHTAAPPSPSHHQQEHQQREESFNYSHSSSSEATPYNSSRAPLAPVPAAALAPASTSSTGSADDFSAFMNFNQAKPAAAARAPAPSAAPVAAAPASSSSSTSSSSSSSHASAAPRAPAAAAPPALYTYADEGSFEDPDFDNGDGESLSRAMNDDELFNDD